MMTRRGCVDATTGEMLAVHLEHLGVKDIIRVSLDLQQNQRSAAVQYLSCTWRRRYSSLANPSLFGRNSNKTCPYYS